MANPFQSSIAARRGGELVVTYDHLFVSESHPELVERAKRLLSEGDEAVRENLTRLAGALTRLAARSGCDRLQITSAYRTPDLNRLVGGVPGSRHLLGLAADVRLFKGGSRLSPREVAVLAKETGLFDEIVVYRTFTHVALPRRGQALPRILYAAGAEGEGDYRYTDRWSRNRGDLYEELEEVASAEAADVSGDGGVAAVLGLAEGDEAAELSDLRLPEEGEADIGDLRFGSVLTRALSESHLNQITSLTQQVASVVGEAELLRTDMNPIVADGRPLPEVVMTITLNASTRDDVNNVLRPLVAMQRRLPFLVARNADLSRLMLGIGSASDTVSRLRQLYPDRSDAELDELARAVGLTSPAALWVPITLRRIIVESQPGGPDLYQVHLVMRFANVLPYVPELTFWRRTRDAAEWARYLSLRGQAGSTVVELLEGGGARLVTGDMKTVEALPPEALASGQTRSPYESYVFKKFYRGLLEEYQPGSYNYFKRRGALEAIPPLSGEGEGAVYESAYPIADPERLFEVYRPEAPIELEYLLALNTQTRQARMQRLTQAFERQARFAELLSATAVLLSSSDDELGSFGKISPLVLSPGYELGVIALSLGATTNAFQAMARRARAAIMQGDRPDLPESVLRYYWDGERVRQAQDKAFEALFTAENVAGDVARAASFVREGGLVDFSVPDRKHPEVFVPFTSEIVRAQEAIIKSYAAVLARLEEASRAPQGSPRRRRVDDPRTGEDRWQQLLAQERAAWRQRAGAEADERDFGAYLMSRDFIARLVGAAWFQELNPQEALELKATADAVARLSAALSEAIAAERTAIAEQQVEGSRTIRAFLSLERAVVESVSLTFTGRYADQQWDGYAHPVSEHVGGGGAEVGLELETNDHVLLDELSALKQSQQALAELRKTRDIVPPLITVHGRGNLLRALGIRRLAYRSHTTSVAQGRPGWYRIRLELIQDEATLTRSENVTREGGLLSGSQYETGPVAPLVVPAFTSRPLTGGAYKPEAPAAFYTVLSGVYAGRMKALRGSFDRESLFQESDYAPLLEEAARRGVVAVQARYLPPPERVGGLLFDVEVSYRAGTGGRRTERLVLDGLLAGFGAFLDFAWRRVREGALTEAAFELLAGQVSAALSTTGASKGYLLSLIDTAQLALEQYRLGEAAAPEAVAASFVNAMSGGLARLPAAETPLLPAAFQDNLTNLVIRALRGEEVPPSAALALLGVRIAGDDIARAITSSEATKDVYLEWLAFIGQPFPRLDMDAARQATEALTRARRRSSRLVPTCYPDLLMPEVRDPVQGVNLLGYDFPYGPGQTELVEDAYLTDYRAAEAMRKMAMLHMASVGLEALSEYVVRERQATGERTFVPGGLDAFGYWAEAYRTRERVAKRPVSPPMEAFVQSFNAAAEDLRRYVLERGVDFPFEAAAGGDYFARMFGELSEKGLLSGSLPKISLTKRDWVNLLRTAQTVKYVAGLVEHARVALAEGASGANAERLRQALESLGRPGALLESPSELSSLAQASSTVVAVQDDFWLAREREQLINLYAADPDTIAGLVGFSDPTAEPVRDELLEKIKVQWARPLGMRRAFPTYALLIAGAVGSSYFRTLSDIYSYTAVQSIEIRSQAASAGQYCDLVVSNMRDRLKSDTSLSRMLVFDQEYDLQLEVKPGTHMFVYLGYGPDVAHLTPFAGRVTSITPGALTQISLSSYSTTLQNPPNEGLGFYTSGWDGQQSLAEAVLYTISKTTGLEGLGRGSLAGAIDILGRNERAQVGDEFRLSVFASVYRALGMPGLGTLFQDEAVSGEVANLVSLVARYGLTSTYEKILGDPRLYENVWLVGGRARYGWTNAVFGGLAEYLTSGKGWGWAALPGESCWSQLKDQSLLFPDYVVTTRPYNAGVPLSELAKHPLRQTLYFGPKHGSYIYTSRPVIHASSAKRLTDQELRQAVNEFLQIEQKPPQERRARLVELYDDIFLRQFLIPLILRTVYEGSQGGLSQLSTDLQDFFRGVWASINPASGAITSGMAQSLLARRLLTDEQRQQIEAALSAAFPNTATGFETLIRPHAMWAPVTRTSERQASRTNLAGGGQATAYADQYLRTWMVGQYYHQRATAALPEQGLPEAALDLFLGEFLEDLGRVAAEASVINSLGGDLTRNPVVRHLRSRLVEKGFVPGGEYRPVAEHHFKNMYTAVVRNETQASMDDPDFANRITIVFPKNPDERLSMYAAQKGDLYSYTIQANPLISPDFIVEKTIAYPNLRYVWADDAGLIADQLVLADPDFARLVEEQTELYRKAQDKDEAAAERLAEVERQLFAALGKMGTLYVKPKFQTVAGNALAQHMRHMYTGTITLKGDPGLHPYHVVHLWDDVKQMHGPVEVDGVYHVFTPQSGFHTVIQPKLHTVLRGVDPTLDTMWMEYASWYYAAATFFPRIGNALLGGAELAGRAGLYRLFAKGAARLLGSAVPGLGWVVAADAAYHLFGGLYDIGREKVTKFVSIMASASDANPLIFVPLTWRGRPYVAGLTGATGPATLRAVLTEALDRGQYQGYSADVLEMIDQYLGRTGLQ